MRRRRNLSRINWAMVCAMGFIGAFWCSVFVIFVVLL